MSELEGVELNAMFDPSYIKFDDFIDKTIGHTSDWQKKFLKQIQDEAPKVTLKELSKVWKDYKFIDYRSPNFEQRPIPEPSSEEMVEILRRDLHRLSERLATSESTLLRRQIFLNAHVHYTPHVNDMILEMFAKMRVLADGGTVGKFELETLVAKIEANLNDDNTETATVLRLRKIIEDTTEVE